MITLDFVYWTKLNSVVVKSIFKSYFSEHPKIDKFLLNLNNNDSAREDVPQISGKGSEK